MIKHCVEPVCDITSLQKLKTRKCGFHKGRRHGLPCSRATIQKFEPTRTKRQAAGGYLLLRNPNMTRLLKYHTNHPAWMLQSCLYCVPPAQTAVASSLRTVEYPVPMAALFLRLSLRSSPARHYALSADETSNANLHERHIPVSPCYPPLMLPTHFIRHFRAELSLPQPHFLKHHALKVASGQHPILLILTLPDDADVSSRLPWRPAPRRAPRHPARPHPRPPARSASPFPSSITACARRLLRPPSRLPTASPWPPPSRST